MAPSGPAPWSHRGERTQIARIPSSSRSSSRTSRCSALVLGLADLHHAARRRGRRRARGRHRPACRSRAESSATDIGVWHSSTILRSSGVACRPSWSGVISASTGAWSSNTPSDELVRPRVSMYGRTSVAREVDASSRASLGRRAGPAHRIADRGSDGLQLGDQARASARSRTSRRAPPSRSRRARRRTVVRSSTASTDVSLTRITKSIAMVHLDDDLVHPAAADRRRATLGDAEQAGRHRGEAVTRAAVEAVGQRDEQAVGRHDGRFLSHRARARRSSRRAS